ncbi:HSP20-like chaperone [Xylariaceae sp. FL0662B]|nr:HSP20-like chaperone [Xylariaceae sp. FL0662B]
MSVFSPRFYSTTEPNFTGLFRLIDDFDNYSGNGRSQPGQQGQLRQHLPTFTPKFDLKETEANYELHGELPGVEKNNVHLEFTDPQTIVVRGRVERTYEAGTPPSRLLEKKPEEATQQGSSGEEHETSSNHSYHRVTVEDDVEDGATTTTAKSNAAPTPATTASEVAKSKEQHNRAAALKHRYWVSERSVGEFSRTFQFPGRIEPDGVSASLNNGILSVTVPKAKKHESRRIAIN